MSDMTENPPATPDFPIIWANAEDEARFWAYAGTNTPLPFAPLEQDVLGSFLVLGCDQAMIHFQAGRFHGRFFNGYSYAVMGDTPALSPAQREAVKSEIIAPLIAQFAGAPCADAVAFQAWSEEQLAEVKQQLAALAHYDLTQPLPKLLDDLDDALQRAVRVSELNVQLTFILYTIMVEFEQFYQDLFGQNALSLHQLLNKYETRLTKGNRRLWELSRRIQSQPALSALFLKTAPTELLSRLKSTPEGRAILDELQAYLADHGRQSSSYIYLRFPYWAEDPTPVLLILQAKLAQSERDLAAELRHKQQQQATAVAAARQQLAAYPQPVIDQFEALLDKAQKATYMLDERIYWMELAPNYHVRQLALALGRAFQQAGCLEQAEDIFYLYLAELRRLAAQPVSQTALIAERKAEMARFEQMSPPPFIGPFPTEMPPSNPVMDVMLTILLKPIPPNEDPMILVGHGASAGIVQGPVKVLRSEREVAKLQPGDILVTNITTPAWMPIFANAAGIITDSGGMLSHPAIVAREMGIPAVVGTLRATAVLHDGQQVRLDGTTGQVRILD